MDSRNIKKIVVVGLFVVVLCLSVAYAAISASLKISGTADISASSWDVHFVKNEEVTIPKGKAVCDIGNVEKLSITDLSAVLKVPGDSCIYTVPVENTGSLPASLTKVINSDLELSFKGSGDNKEEDENLLKQYVKYEVNYGGTEINDSTDFSSIYTLEQNEKETVTLRISFSIDAPDIPKEAVEITDLGTEFVFENKAENNGQEVESRYSIKYKGFSGAGYKTRIESGQTFTQKIGNVEILYVKMGDRILNEEEYTYQDGTITIGNVTGDIIIASTSYAPSFSDKSGANTPVLNGDMIPVVYNEDLKVWQKQDLNKSYDYSKQVWANAVTVTESSRPTYKTAKAGTIIKDADINTMWVWIPRYSYTIKSEDGGNNYYGKASYGNKNPTRLLPGEIDVKFIGISTTESGTAQYTTEAGTSWRTNEAFNFDNTPRAGIWVAKFEPSGSLGQDGQACTNENCNVSNVTILPNKVSMRSQTVSSFFYMARSMQVSYSNIYGFSSTGDLHMAKNDEWGAVAYLSQSKYGKYGNSDYTGLNKEVYQNYSKYTTGLSNGSPPSSNPAEVQYEYNDLSNLGDGRGQAGPGASTTGTIYGIYDMSGCANEYVMSAVAYDDGEDIPMSGNDKNSNSGFNGKVGNGSEYSLGISFPESKYYNMYKTSDATLNDINLSKTACNGQVCYGHALSETYGADSGYYGWYSDNAFMAYRSYPWSVRGGYGGTTGVGSNAGLFYSDYHYGSYNNNISTRLILTS